MYQAVRKSSSFLSLFVVVNLNQCKRLMWIQDTGEKIRKSRYVSKDVGTFAFATCLGRCAPFLRPCAPAGVSLLRRVPGRLKQPCSKYYFDIGRTSLLVVRSSTRNWDTHSVRRNLFWTQASIAVPSPQRLHVEYRTGETKGIYSC